MSMDSELMGLDELPDDAAAVVAEAERAVAVIRDRADEHARGIQQTADDECAAIRARAETDVAAVQQEATRELAPLVRELVDSLRTMQEGYAREGKLDEALAIRARVRQLRANLLGPDVVAWGSHFFCKMPRDGKTVSWHQDASYWPLTPSKAVTVWLAIDDADRGNACMKYIPGSHKYGHLTYKMSETDENNVLDQTVENAEGIGAPIYVELKAGEASLHSDLTLHGSEANTSDRRRCGLTLRYTATDVRAHMGWHEKGVIVSGPPADHWANRERPAEE